jgi:hypothetical protein
MADALKTIIRIINDSATLPEGFKEGPPIKL